MTYDEMSELRQFMQILDAYDRLYVHGKLTKQLTPGKNSEFQYSVHSCTANFVLECFGVPMGEAGIGVVPVNAITGEKETGTHKERDEGYARLWAEEQKRRGYE